MTERVRRFVHVFSTFGAGGPQVRAVQLMHHLGDSCEHVVLAMDGNTDARAMLREDVAVQFAERPTARGFLATRRAQMQWLREQQPDLVLTYNWGAIESVAAAKKAALPIVHHEDGFGPEEAQARLRRRSWMRRWLLRGVPVVVPSLVLREIARTEWRLRENDVRHLVNGVDLDRFAPNCEPVPGLVVGTVGGLRPEKDHHNLLQAFAQCPDSVRLCLVGSGALESELRELAEQLGVSSRVEFAGQTNDTSASYRSMDLFVLSSRTEQMPIAMLEAMATGLPVVATDVGDVRQILPDDADACVVPREDSDALAEAMRLVLADEDLRSRLGQRNRRIVEQHFESSVCLERFCAVYRAVMR